MRAYPASRRHPQFSRPALEKTLNEAGLAYEWHGKALGGMRPSYAAHMLTEEFQAAALALMARSERVCLPVPESDPGNCHSARAFAAAPLAPAAVQVVPDAQEVVKSAVPTDEWRRGCG